MYLSSILIDLGTNPDRPRPGRLWLRNLYRVHQRLCMAFPTDSRKETDGQFLAPYRQEDFPEQGHMAEKSAKEVESDVLKDVHAPRNVNRGFLFRIDPLPGPGRAMILVQSAARPDWSYAFQNADHLVAAPIGVRPFDPGFRPNLRLRFRILANPVRKVSPRSLDLAGKPFEKKWVGKDVPVPTADLAKWLERRSEPGWSAQASSNGKQSPPGFRLVGISEMQSGYVYANKSPEKDKGRRIRSARYEGVLEVTDADHFRNTVISGIGPAKAFGFGLLSVAPWRP
jgi:CRISPR system Cascade subunit CasE